jgi:hypothetical protein
MEGAREVVMGQLKNDNPGITSKRKFIELQEDIGPRGPRWDLD